jgi:GT2 family glycosyltransferase
MPKNIRCVETDPDVEFVVLDYSSKDGLEDWIKTTFSREISSGRISYWKYPTAKFYDSSHAKNLSQLAASGDVVANLDADIYLPDRISSFIREQFFMNPRIVIRSACGETAPGTTGFIASRKEDFIKLRGYDESFRGWGHDDIDFLWRAFNAGFKMIQTASIGEIPTMWQERIANMDYDGTPEESEMENAKRVDMRHPGYIVNPEGWGRGKLFKNFNDQGIDFFHR